MHDTNAAINLRNLAVSSTVSACGGKADTVCEARDETGPGDAGIQQKLTMLSFA